MLKNYLFHIGIVIFSITLFVEHLFSIKSGVTDFIKGLGCGLELIGVVILIVNNAKR